MSATTATDAELRELLRPHLDADPATLEAAVSSLLDAQVLLPRAAPVLMAAPDGWVEAGATIRADLTQLGSLIGQVRGSAGEDPALSGSAAQFSCETFTMRAYCGGLCDDCEQCPANFTHPRTGLEIRWYKRAGRGTEVNKIVPAATWAGIYAQAVDAIEATREAATLTR